MQYFNENTNIPVRLSIEIEMIHLEEKKKRIQSFPWFPKRQCTNVYYKAIITKTVW